MPFVKVDCSILDSTLWFDKDARDVFMTALLMAEPCEFSEPMPQLAVDSLQRTGWSVPPGWYGFVPAAGLGIVHRAKVNAADGIEALRRLGNPEESSRTPDHDGRRLVRIDGGYLVLNYIKYRERDYTGAERSRRYRERLASRRGVTASHRDITQAEAEVEAEVEATEQKQQSATAAAPVSSLYPKAPIVARQRPHGDGPLAGTLPKDHLGHGFCGTRFCVSAKHHQTLMRAYGDGAEPVLGAWLAEFDASLQGGYGGPVWLSQHWDAHLVAIGRVKPAPARPVPVHHRTGTREERLAAVRNR